MVDGANVLPADVKAALETRLAEVERQSKHQFVVVTVKSLEGENVEAYSLRLFNRWGIGRKGVNDGVGLLVAPDDRKVRIEVGGGLGKALTDAETGAIIEKDIVPRFKTGDMPGGITAGSEAIIREITQ
ncbi:uncharacterized protein J2W22_000953 [Sphingomonas kyeonggiensis]|uniref:TPM domain-containing protein n=1 Tax=Sphingomonas kyeonggiensis TaxID=1268553 RepID=UPI00277E70DC|nr:TPM domain-containing protein [Sphingomonas kyeonggiensis]MDQ0248906.1 uncharacterized protein [Sphingomonas kyeonggiensis]